jgi:hypothetical protein
MKRFRLSRYALLLILVCNPILIRGQAQSTGQTAPQQSQLPKLSPGAEEVSKELGITQLIERLYKLPESERGMNGGTMSLEALTIRQQITEIVVGASLDIDGLIAEIDNETAQLNSIRSDLESRRDRAQKINNIASIVTGGALGVVGTALQFKDTTANLGNAIGVSGGAASVVLSIIGIKQQSGGQRALVRSPNMLAKIFDRQAEFHSEYPDDVWTYLNAVRPTESDKGTRRARLIDEWQQTGRIDKPDTPKGQKKIDVLTSSISQQRALTLDQIADREAMLGDVRAEVSLMKRDLSKLMLALRTSSK